jgi:hypothetical protein
VTAADGDGAQPAPVDPAGQVQAQPEPAPAAPAPEPAPAAAAPQPEPQHHAPLSALLDERERRQAAERQRDELQAWRTQQEAAQRAAAAPPPDPAEDPAGYQSWRDTQLNEALYEHGRDISRRFAVLQHGEEAVKEAYEWGVRRCDEDPHFNAKVRNSQDPYGVVLAEFRRDQIASNFKQDEWDAFQAWRSSQQPQNGLGPVSVEVAPQPQPHPAPAVTPPPKPVPPRASIAAAPSASHSGQPLPADGEGTFERMFPT